MPESDLAERLDAVERAITDDETDLRDVRDRAALTAEKEHLEERIDGLEATVQELEAAVDAVRGYAGNVRAVNRDVERRASAALAKAEALESAVSGSTRDAAGSAAGTGRSRVDDPVDSVGAQSGQQTQSAGDVDFDRRFAEGLEPSSRSDAGHNERDWECTQRDGFETPEGRNERDDGSTGVAEPESGAGQTEQFIERIRDAL